MDRRVFLRSACGTIVGLPFLESLGFAQGTKTPEGLPGPYAVFVYQPMGPDIETWWPTTLGNISESTLKGRATEPLIPFAKKISIIKGLGHGNENFWTKGDHGESIAMTLSGARVTFANGTEGTAYSEAMSIDHAIAKAFGGTPLNLGLPNTGGPTLSWSGSGKSNPPEYNPLKAYRNLFPNGETPSGSKPAVDVKKDLRKGVNDLVREQFKALLASKKLSAADKERLSLHQQNIRDLETEIISDFKMSDENRNEILNYKGNGNDNGDRKMTYKMQANIAAIAAATGQKRAITLQLGGTFMDTYFDADGNAGGNGWHDQVSHSNNVQQLRIYDRLNQKYFAKVLEALNQYEIEPGGRTLLDFGVTTFIMSLGFGAGHWRYDLPHIVAGSAGGRLKTGQYIDLIAGGADRSKKFVPTNRLFSTIGQAFGPVKVGDKEEYIAKDFNAGTPPKDANVRLDQKGVIPQILA